MPVSVRSLRGVKFLDDRVANPSYVGLALIGVAMVLIGPWRFDMLWIAVTIGLYVALAATGLLLYTPTLSRQIRVYDRLRRLTRCVRSR